MSDSPSVPPDGDPIYRRLLDSAHVILLALDLEGGVTLVNRFGLAFLGWTLPELLGQDFIERCVPPDRQAETREKLKRVHEGDDTIVESPVRTRSGEIRLIEWQTSYVRDESGRLLGTLSSGVDVTAVRRIAAELQEVARRSAETEREFREMFAANPLPMWIYDLETLRFLEVNHAALARYGYARDEFLAMTIADIRPPEDVDRLRDNLRESREPWQASGCWRHRTHSGELIDVEITSHLITFSQRAAALVVAQDITRRRRAEAAREASEERYRTLFEYAPDGIVIADRESYYIDANASMCRMLGYTHEEFVGLHASDIVAPAEVPFIGEALEIITTTADYQREWRFRRKDGSIFPAEVIATVMPDGNLLAMVHDVTDRIAASEATRRAEERLRFAMETARIGVWDIDYTTGTLRWSEILEDQFGIPRGTFPGTFEAFVERIHPEDREGMLAQVSEAMRSGDQFTVRHRSVHPDGSVHWLEGAGRVVLGPDRRPLRGIGISMDVTERRSLEAQFQQAQKMEAIGRLAGGIAHDFNNLLTVILGNCEFLLADLTPGDPREGEVREIEKAGASAAALTRQLLAFSRREIIEPRLLDLNEVATGMRRMLGRLIGENIRVALVLRPETAMVMADPGQIQQVLLNLSVNARDAMPNGGTLTIETREVELDGQYAQAHLSLVPGRYVVLTISDTGVGMTPEVQARLFEPFFTTKATGKGTGLGLATVYGIVSRSGGSVNVYSEVGLGTTFNVYLPAAKPGEVVPRSATEASERKSGHETLLVVEDEAGLREVTRRMLERNGYSVVVAGDAVEAQRVFEARGGEIDLVLTDVVMPGGTGPELVDRLLVLRPGLRVVFMSGYTEDSIVQHGVLKPGIAFLHKPFTSDTLHQKVREALEGPAPS